MITGEWLTVWTIRGSLVCFAATLLMRLGGSDRQRWARVLWTVGLCFALAHVGCALHFIHGWSHRAALEHTARRTAERVGWPFAGGLYVNYVFMAVWGFDAGWWWVAAGTYLCRSTAWTVAVYGFLVFIAFQATVVFETGATRWIAAIALAWIAVRFARHSARRPAQQAIQPAAQHLNQHDA